MDVSEDDGSIRYQNVNLNFKQTLFIAFTENCMQKKLAKMLS